MPEVKYYLTELEFFNLRNRAMDLGHAVWPTRKYAVSRPPAYSSIEEIDALSKYDKYAFILTRGDYCRHPIVYRDMLKRGKRYWYWSAGNCGPAIQAYYWAPYKRGGAKLIPGSLFCYDGKFMNPNREFEVAGKPIATALRELLAPIRKTARRVKFATRSPYVSQGIEEMLAKGWTLAPP